MSSKDVHITFSRRAVPDIAKLAQALLDLTANLDPEIRDRLVADNEVPEKPLKGITP